jgi:hypothetical protein
MHHSASSPTRPSPRRAALTDAVQVLESHVGLLRRLAAAAMARGEPHTASAWEERALLAGERLARVRETLAALPPTEDRS